MYESCHYQHYQHVIITFASTGDNSVPDAMNNCGFFQRNNCEFYDTKRLSLICLQHTPAKIHFACAWVHSRPRLSEALLSDQRTRDVVIQWLCWGWLTRMSSLWHSYNHGALSTMKLVSLLRMLAYFGHIWTGEDTIIPTSAQMPEITVWNTYLRTIT